MSILPEIDVVLNRFWVKQLTDQDRRVSLYSYRYPQPPDTDQEHKAVWSMCYKLGLPAVPMGDYVVAKGDVPEDKLRSDSYSLTWVKHEILSPTHSGSRHILEQLERRWLESSLKRYSTTSIDRASEGGLIWWIRDDRGVEESGQGWQVHRGFHIDVGVDHDAHLFLEIDLHYRFYSPWTLAQWQQIYPDAPFDYVRNTYPDSYGKYRTWHYLRGSDQNPEDLVLPGKGCSLADYHRNLGASEEDIGRSRVVYVRQASGKHSDELPHLSGRLSPSLTMEVLNHVEAESDDQVEQSEIKEVFRTIRPSLDQRLERSTEIATRILKENYGRKVEQIPVEPAIVKGCLLPPAKLLAKHGPVHKTSEVLTKGCVQVGEDKFGCLDLTNRGEFPEEVAQCLRKMGQSSGVEMRLGRPKTLQDLPATEYDRHRFWDAFAEKGVKTFLVVSDWLEANEKTRIRKEALESGIATQFMIPKGLNTYKAMNITLGLLVKAGWQPVKLEPIPDPHTAELVIGFDTGTNRSQYFGTPAFATLADGQGLGWELPNVQPGETLSPDAVRQVVLRLTARFEKRCQRLPSRILLLRDGLVQTHEFTSTIEALSAKNIAVDVVGIRKSGAGRMGKRVDQRYQDADKGVVVFLPQEDSLILVTTEPISQDLSSVRPIRAVRFYGDASLESLATQIYHLSCLHPGSGYQSCRLPWVLHLADRSSKEFQRIGQMDILQNLDREKLIAV